MTTKSISQRQATNYIRERMEFKASAMYGSTSRYVYTMGMLSLANRMALREDEARGTLDYIVYSYETPLAWHTSDRGWTYPEARYSATTSTRHNPHVAMALGNQPEIWMRRLADRTAVLSDLLPAGKRVKGMAAAKSNLAYALARVLDRPNRILLDDGARLVEAARMVLAGDVPGEWLGSYLEG